MTDFADKMPPVRADAEQLLQVFLNLSLNALQAMPERRQAVDLDRAAAFDAPGRRGRVPGGPLPRHRRRDPGRRSQEPLHSVLHDQGEGDRAGPADQPAHHREPRRHDRGAVAAGRGRDVHGAAADRGRRLRRLPEAGRAAEAARRVPPVPRPGRCCRRRRPDARRPPAPASRGAEADTDRPSTGVRLPIP